MLVEFRACLHLRRSGSSASLTPTEPRSSAFRYHPVSPMHLSSLSRHTDILLNDFRLCITYIFALCATILYLFRCVAVSHSRCATSASFETGPFLIIT